MTRAELSEKLRPWMEGRAPARLVTPTNSGLAGARPSTIISEVDPQRFMAAFATAVAGASDVFLCDPAWGEAERAQLTALLAPGSVLPAPCSSGWLLIPTGGSSGGLKFARHDQQTLGMAIDGFMRHFNLKRVNAVGVLPLHHVSGLMAWLRCAWSGGEYRHLDWKAIERGELPDLPAKEEGWVLSFVPTQLERLLRSETGRAVEWLRQFRIIFVGGAPAAPALLDKAAAARLPISLGYGMTETAAMVTALLPAEFLAGRRDSGRALPHAAVSVGADGLVRIKAGSLFRGYYPARGEDVEWVTADLGRIDAAGHLMVVGRADWVIITGGEKVNPTEVEGALLATGEFAEVVVVGVPDAQWGQAVVAVFPTSEKPDLAKVAALIGDHLSAWKRPKRYVALADWPLTTAGKVNRQRVAALLKT